MTEQNNGQPDIEVKEITGALAVGAGDRAAIDVQIATAKQYPRSITASLNEAKTLATYDEETAGSMMYALPRRPKAIEGPSVRLAEVMAYSWGNLRAEADIIGDDGKHIVAMGTCFDLEKNVAIRIRVKRRITDKHGRRFNDDMIGTTGNAAISIAFRNAVFRTIPQVYVTEVYQAARKASLGKGGTLTQKRQKALEWFAKLNVKEEQVFDLLGVKGMADIGEDELITLRGIVNAIKEGETTVERLFAPERSSDESSELTAKLREKSGKKDDKAEDEAARREDLELASE